MQLLVNDLYLFKAHIIDISSNQWCVECIAESSSSAHSKPGSLRSPVVDFSSPCVRRKSFSSLMADLHDIGADSPTQLQLLGSSLMEGLLADSPRSSIAHFSDPYSGSSNGRLINALNLFSPVERLVNLYMIRAKCQVMIIMFFRLRHILQSLSKNVLGACFLPPNQAQRLALTLVNTLKAWVATTQILS